VFAQLQKLNDRGRDSSAIAQSESSIFVMGLASLIKIEEKFSNIYTEMLELGVLRHKKHQVRIAKYVNQFMK
jgi:hypothetical protein